MKEMWKKRILTAEKPMVYKKKDDRKHESLELKDVIREMLQNYHIDEKFDHTRLIASWERLMGRPVASRTTRLFVKDNVLFVRLSSAPLKNEMNINKGRVLEIFKKEFGEKVLKDIVFQ